jgi:hypothetical protein
MNGPELYHHGILGQKWGVRRYQNDDGTWTTVGKERRRVMRKWDPRRFQNEDGSLTEEGKARYMDAARRGKLNYKKLSNADLDMINNRFNKERLYKKNVEEAMASLPSVKLKNALLKVGEEAAKGALDALSKGSGGMGDMLKTAFTIAPEKSKGGGGSKGDKPKGAEPKETASEETTPKEEKKEVAKKVKKGKDAAENVMESIGERSVADVSTYAWLFGLENYAGTLPPLLM